MPFNTAWCAGPLTPAGAQDLYVALAFSILTCETMLPLVTSGSSLARLGGWSGITTLSPVAHRSSLTSWSYISGFPNVNLPAGLAFWTSRSRIAASPSEPAVPSRPDALGWAGSCIATLSGLTIDALGTSAPVQTCRSIPNFNTKQAYPSKPG